MYLDRKFGLSLSHSEITLLFDLNLYLDRTLAQRKAKSKVKVAHYWILTLNKLDCSFLAPNNHTRFNQIWFKIVTAGAMTDRQKDTHTHTHQQTYMSQLHNLIDHVWLPINVQFSIYRSTLHCFWHSWFRKILQPKKPLVHVYSRSLQITPFNGLHGTPYSHSI